MKVEFYRDLHRIEFDQQERLSSRGDAIVALFTTLCGLLGYLVLSFKSGEVDPTLWFWIFIGAASLALAISAGSLIASSILPHLRDIDTASRWHRYQAELEAEYKTSQGAFQTAQEEFDDALIATYVEATDANVDTNTRRGYRLRDSTTAAFAAVLLLAAAFGTHYYSSSTEGTQMTLAECRVCESANQPNPSATKPGTRPVPGPRPPPKE